ncbi:DUF1642 domain-containing protein [Lactococcus taiwanensis]|uniref:DUF1642 domain-containing protein n=1 Tax=Lactococcus taiwanensis TaxID=1151742 RepID=UPI003517B3CF
MTKTFEEELDYFIERELSLDEKLSFGGRDVLIKFFSGWHSDEEYQLLLRDRDTLKQGNDNLFKDHLKLVKENEELKSQLEHQPLPEVPECVGEYIEECKKNKYALNLALDLMAKEYTSRKTELSTWIMSNQEQFAKAYFDKYTVQKPKQFYLKNKLTTSYLVLEKATGYYSHFSKSNAESVYGEHYQSKFTQEEIDSMQAGSYEKIEVEE